MTWNDGGGSLERHIRKQRWMNVMNVKEPSFRPLIWLVRDETFVKISLVSHSFWSFALRRPLFPQFYETALRMEAAVSQTRRKNKEIKKFFRPGPGESQTHLQHQCPEGPYGNLINERRTTTMIDIEKKEVIPFLASEIRFLSYLHACRNLRILNRLSPGYALAFSAETFFIHD